MKTRRLAIAVAAFLTALAWAAPAGPALRAAEDPALETMRRRADAYFAAIGSGDEATIRAFLAESFPFGPGAPSLEERVERSRNLRARLGRLTPGPVTVEGPRALSVKVTAEKEQAPLRFVFRFEEEPPHRIAGIEVRAGEDAEGPEGGLPPIPVRPTMSEAERTGAVDAWLAGLTARDEFSGAVLVARDGRTLYRKAFGLAHRGFGVPNTPETRFNTGSIDKTFTQVAIAQLVEQGRIALDDPLSKHLPDYPNRELASKIRIGDLVRHASGLGDIFGPRYRDTPKERLREPRDYFPLFAPDPPLFEPGSKRRYSNAGYVVLGAVVEAVTGKRFDDYLRENIFGPAGMTLTGAFERDIPLRNVAVGYTRGGPGGTPGEIRENTFMIPVKGSGAGGGYSTLDDLVRFDAALRSHRLTSPAGTRWVLSDHAGSLGPVAEPDRGRPREPQSPSGGSGASGGHPGEPPLAGGLGIAGGAPGLNASLESGDGLVVIVLANLDPPVAEEAALRIREAMEPTAAPPGRRS